MKLDAEKLACAKHMIAEAQDRVNHLTFDQARELNVGLYALREILMRNDGSALRTYAMLNEQAPKAIRQLAINICLATDLMRPVELPTGAPFVDYFEVAAGKYDGDERNYKYIDRFATMAAALHAYRTCSDYAFSELQYVDQNGLRFDVELSLVK